MTFSPRACWTIGSLLVGGLYLSHAAIFGNYIADDAGISLAYARNIAAGHGPVLYPGAEPVEAYSNPLWTLLLAGAAAAGLDGADGVPLLKTLSLLLGLATLVVAAKAPSIIYPDDAGLAWLAPVLLASLAPFVFWTASGMENALYAFLMLATVVRQLHELRDDHARPWSALTTAGVALTRPEGIAFATAFLLHRIVFRDGLRRMVVWSLIVCGIYALFLGSRVIMFGEWVPNTYYAKVDLYDRHLGSLIDYISNADDRGTQYARASASAVWPLLALAGVGLVDWRQRRTGLLMGGILAGTLLYVIFVGGDFWPVGRFFTATLPLVALAAQHALHRLTPRTGLAGLLLGAVLAGRPARAGSRRARRRADRTIPLRAVDLPRLCLRRTAAGYHSHALHLDTVDRSDAVPRIPGAVRSHFRQPGRRWPARGVRSPGAPGSTGRSPDEGQLEHEHQRDDHDAQQNGHGPPRQGSNAVHRSPSCRATANRWPEGRS